MPNRRRRSPQYLLEVKVHREGRAKARARLVGGLLAAVSLTALSGYGLYRAGCYLGNRLVFENPRYNIRQIVVENDGVLAAADVTRFAAVEVGQNLLALDLETAQRGLEMIPLIRRAEVRRVLPDRLVIKIEERMPVAQLQVSSAALAEAEFLIDRSGTVLKPLKRHDGSLVRPETGGRLPVLTGIPLAEIQVGRKIGNEQVYRALELLDEYHQSVAGSLLGVAQVDLRHPRKLVVTTVDGARLHFDEEDFVQQLRRLSVIAHWASQHRRQLASADLSVARNVPVKFMN